MTNHCTHEQSQAMKEIGFDMPVRDYYIGNDIKLGTTLVNWNNNLTSAPTHAEALEWFREKKGLDGWVRPYKDPEGIKYYGYETYQVHNKYNCFETHHEATSAIIDKMIEITKKQKA